MGIDQRNIEVDLRCLPIFLGGCRKLVILCGATYLSRLWCIMELFFYVMMGGGLDHVDLIPVVPGDEDREDAIAAIAEAFEQFDAAACMCFLESDKRRMLMVIE